MELISVSCNHCGAPIRVPPSARFVTCAHCNSQLEVKSTGSATYTEVLEALDGRTQRMTEQLEEIALQNELERLDREWDRAREGFQSVDQNGRRHDPSVIGSWVAAVVFGTVGCAAMVFGAIGHGAGFLVFIGILVAIVGVVVGVTGADKARRFERAKASHHRKRRDVAVRLGQVRAARAEDAG